LKKTPVFSLVFPPEFQKRLWFSCCQICGNKYWMFP